MRMNAELCAVAIFRVFCFICWNLNYLLQSEIIGYIVKVNKYNCNVAMFALNVEIYIFSFFLIWSDFFFVALSNDFSFELKLTKTKLICIWRLQVLNTSFINVCQSDYIMFFFTWTSRINMRIVFFCGKSARQLYYDRFEFARLLLINNTGVTMETYFDYIILYVYWRENVFK